MKILMKVATEFNVDLLIAVEHLQKKGFEIDRKPTAKVTDEMYEELRIQFRAKQLKKSMKKELKKERII
ncbi:MAG: hypothetical protein IPI90_17605 [Saprospiraceae bacterium]|nr:hypothetical protein [Candidatus Vicinibacter affinis]